MVLQLCSWLWVDWAAPYSFWTVVLLHMLSHSETQDEEADTFRTCCSLLVESRNKRAYSTSKASAQVQHTLHTMLTFYQPVTASHMTKSKIHGVGKCTLSTGKDCKGGEGIVCKQYDLPHVINIIKTKALTCLKVMLWKRYQIMSVT